MPIYKQPILHFLLSGVLLFVLYQWLNPDGAGDDGIIVIDNDALLEFMQYGNRAFKLDRAQDLLSRLSTEERQVLVRQLAREEALYREALKLGLDRNDYVIKQRLIQKMEYLSQGYQPDSQDLPREVVERYFAEHNDRYVELPRITFTHVFVDTQQRPAEQAWRMANELLEQLRSEHVDFSGSLGYGDRFLYHSNYVERSTDFVASHFGESFASKVFALEANGGWQGPIESEHGLHLVLVAALDPGGLPPLEGIYAKVARDARQALLEQRMEEAVQQVIDQYEVVDKTSADKHELPSVALSKAG